MRRWIYNRYFPVWAPFFLRLALGTVFMAHGWVKLHGPLGTPEGFNIADWGWPRPEMWAWAVATVEFFGGLLVICGLLTRFAAAAIASVMAAAIYNVKLQEGFIGGFEFEFTLLMVAVALVFSGGGRFSIDYEILGWGAPPRRHIDLEETNEVAAPEAEQEEETEPEEIEEKETPKTDEAEKQAEDGG
jgi:putative oxidoreductase